jgi:uncharacterized membrane protein
VKLDETSGMMKSEYKKYIIVMIMCFIVGGSSIILFSFQAYDSLLRQNRFPERLINNTTEFGNRSDTFNNSDFFRQSLREIPLENFYSPQSLMLLFSGVVLLAAGICVWILTREKEISSEKEKIKSLLLLPEERIIINELKKNKGNMTQSQLVKNTGLSKVKMHRIVNKLCSKGIIKKYPYGLTNKIVLEKEI